jgi:hypothetical protein
MKNRQIFWGSLLITVGGLFLLNNIIHLEFAWNFLWKLWPLVFIIWGISALTTNVVVRDILSAIKAVLLALVIFSGFKSCIGSDCEFNFDDNDFNDGSYNSQTFDAPYSSSSKTASFLFKAGSGKYTIKDTSGELFFANVKSSTDDFQFDNNTDKNEVKLTMSNKTHFHTFGKENSAEIKLNSNPIWDMEFDIGAASANLDLSGYKVKNVILNAGASSLKIKLGDFSNESTLTIKTGVSSIEISVPASSGCEIISKTGLASKDYNGFNEESGNKYRTDNFSSASKKIYLNIDAGVSSVKVSRY